jgi:hypothetical protein
MRYDVKMTSCGVIHTPIFMKICRGVEEILMFCFSNLNGYNVGLTDERGL